MGEVTEVDPKEALEEGKQTGKPASSAKPAGDPVGKSTDVIDTLVPKAEPRAWKFSDGDSTREYIQRPLSFFGKMQFFSLVGEVIDKAVSGEEGLRLSSLFEVPGSRGSMLSASDFRDADTFVQAVGKLLTYAPDFLEKCYCIWLGVPDHEKPWVIAMMSRPAEEGGLSDDAGIEIIETFIDQNWEALEDFFRDKIVTLRDRIQARRKEAQNDE